MNIAARLPVPETKHVECVPLRAIPSDWDKQWLDLAAHASEPNPFAECWFMRAAITHLGCGEDDRMLAVWQSQRLIGLIPLTHAARYGRIPVKHVKNWTHYHCFYGGPLVRAGSEPAFWAAALSHLDATPRSPSFLHIVGFDPTSPSFAALAGTRTCDIVQRTSRAMLASSLDARAYYETHVRAKKRKELARLRARLEELGKVTCKRSCDAPADSWIAEFLALEASGWKGRDGTAMGSTAATRSFFVDAIRAGHHAGKVEMLRLSLDRRPIAMLVNFMTPPGSFSFKIAFDEAFARFSPGVLVQLENFANLDRDDLEWMDSCAVEDHPMINSLWAERRQIVRVTIPLGGVRRRAVFTAVRAIENTAARIRARR